MKFDLNNPRTLATTAVMTALVIALTRYASFPNGLGGYIHLGDIAIFFTSFAFGPWAGLIAGAVGTGVADVLGGYAAFAPLSAIVHGLEGFAAGMIYRRMPNMKGLALGLVVGSAIVIAGYFIGEYLVPVLGGPAVAFSEVPFNAIQMLVGSLGGLVYLAVERAYPRIRQAD